MREHISHSEIRHILVKALPGFSWHLRIPSKRLFNAFYNSYGFSRSEIAYYYGNIISKWRCPRIDSVVFVPGLWLSWSCMWHLIIWSERSRWAGFSSAGDKGSTHRIPPVTPAATPVGTTAADFSTVRGQVRTSFRTRGEVHSCQGTRHTSASKV